MIVNALSRRAALHLAAGAIALGGLTAALASTATFAPYTKAGFDAALKGSKPVLVHVHAEWCPVCKKQELVFNDLAKSPEFAKLTAIRVDFDKDVEFKKTHNVNNQSVVIVFKGGKEIARSGGETAKDKLAALVAKAQ